MARVTINESTLTDIGDAIRAKTGGSALIDPADMADEIEAIPSGATLITKSITENGTYNASSDNADGYSSVVVDIPSDINTLMKKTLKKITYAMLDGVTSVGTQFGGCWDVEEIEIPTSVVTFETNAMYQVGVPGKKIYYAGTMGDWLRITMSNVNSSPLARSALPRGYLYINHELVSEIIVPSEITAIGNYAFYGTENIITKISLGSISSIGQNAFSETHGDYTLRIPDSVTSIGTTAFHQAELSKVCLGSGVVNIGAAAFYPRNKHWITTLVCLATTPPTIQSNTFLTLPAATPIYVPAESISAYQSATNWAQYSAQFTAITPAILAEIETW